MAKFTYMTRTVNFIRLPRTPLPSSEALETSADIVKGVGNSFYKGAVRGGNIGGVLGAGVGGYTGIKNEQESDDPNLLRGAAKGLGGALLGNVGGSITGGAVGGGVGLGSGYLKAGYKLKDLEKTNPKLFDEVMNLDKAFSTPLATANFNTLLRVGAGVGAVKGALDQPGGEVLDPNTNEITPRTYNPLQRIGNIALNATAGAGIGLGASHLKLGDSHEVGRYIGRGRKYMGDKLSRAKQYLPQVSVVRGEAPGLSDDIQQTLQQIDNKGWN